MVRRKRYTPPSFWRVRAAYKFIKEDAWVRFLCFLFKHQEVRADWDFSSDGSHRHKWFRCTRCGRYRQSPYLRKPYRKS